MTRFLSTLCALALPLLAHSEIIFSVDFDDQADGTFTFSEFDAAFRGSENRHTSTFVDNDGDASKVLCEIISDSDAYSGKSLKVRVGDQRYKLSMGYVLPGVDPTESDGSLTNYVYNPDYDELWVSWWGKANNFNQTGGDIKTMQMAVNRPGSGYLQGRCLQSNEASVQQQHKTNDGNFYLFAQDMNDVCSGGYGRSAPPDFISWNESNDTWHHYEYGVRINKNGQSNGWVRGYLDDVLLDWGDESMDWVDDGDSDNWNMFKFRIQKTGGGDTGPNAYVVLDNYAISTTRLGSTGFGAPTAVVPGGPLNIQVQYPE